MSLLSFAARLVLLLFPALQPTSSPALRHAYEILLKGSVAGTEIVSETIDAGGNLVVSSEHEMLLSDGLETKRVAFTTALVLAKDSRALMSYKLQYLSGESRDSCTVTVRGDRIDRVLVRGNRRSDTSTALQPGTVLLEPNVYYLYGHLVARYDHGKGGRQLFQAYLPPVGADIPVALTWIQDDAIDGPGGPVTARRYRYEFVPLSEGLLWVDAAGRLFRLVNPAQELEVIRKRNAP